MAFEDRADCTGCLTLISRWPEYEGTDPRVGEDMRCGGKREGWGPRRCGEALRRALSMCPKSERVIIA